MKSKQLKQIFIGCVILFFVLFFATSVKAVDATNNTTSTYNYIQNTSSSNETTSSDNTSSNTSNSSVSTTSANYSDDEEDAQNTTSFENYTGVADSSSTKVSNYSPNSELGISGILNVLLIVVGILLILLAIAILIKVK